MKRLTCNSETSLLDTLPFAHLTDATVELESTDRQFTRSSFKSPHLALMHSGMPLYYK